jgi:hypothetical protein
MSYISSIPESNQSVLNVRVSRFRLKKRKTIQSRWTFRPSNSKLGLAAAKAFQAIDTIACVTGGCGPCGQHAQHQRRAQQRLVIPKGNKMDGLAVLLQAAAESSWSHCDEKLIQMRWVDGI